MAENDNTNYEEALLQALAVRKEWLETSELIKLKEAIRSFQTSFSSLYNIYLKKKIINEDPYKAEAKISELEVPDTEPINEAKRVEQMSIRLSNFDNQLDFLANFYQLSVDFLNLERIKKILGLIRFIDWINLTPDSQAVNTRIVAEMNIQVKTGTDKITLSIMSESISKLAAATTEVIGIMKELTAYYKERYKLNVRQNITMKMTAANACVINIKKKFPSALPKTVFYQELIEEIIKEDYSKEGPEIKNNILQFLRTVKETPKAAKPKINFKNILLEGTKVIGSAHVALSEIAVKIDENSAIMANQERSIWRKLIQLIRQMMKKEPEEVFYELEYIDQTKGMPVKEKLNFSKFRYEMDKKTKILASFVNGPAAVKLSIMTEEQIMGHLEKNIRELQVYHRILNALDEYFKTKTSDTERVKIKGIKPELSTIKNSIVRANQLKFEYSSQKEQEEQLKRLGINVEGS